MAETTLTEPILSNSRALSLLACSGIATTNVAPSEHVSGAPNNAETKVRYAIYKVHIMHTVYIGLQLQCTVQVSKFRNYYIYAKCFFRVLFSANWLISAS
jgi:hypothetical protein